MLEILKKAVNEDSLTSTPLMSDPTHEWADYCELVCLISSDSISSEDIKKRVGISADFEPKDVIERSKSLREDKISGIVEDAFSLMRLRQSLLTDMYPFVVNEDGQVSESNVSYSHKQIIYTLLLLSANLKYVKHFNNFTSDFEVICLYSMRSFLPNANVKLFGSSNVCSLGDEDKFINTKLKQRCQELGEFLSIDIHNDTINLIPEKNLGDGGLDIVATIDMNDKRISHPVFFAQCACGKDAWMQKQLSTSHLEWDKWLHTYQTSIQNYIFVPSFLMTNDKEWVDKTDITHAILIDRFRILTLCNEFDTTVLSLNNL